VLEEVHQVGDDLDFPLLGKKGNCRLVGRCRMVPLPPGGEAAGSLGTGGDGSPMEKRLSNLLVAGILELPGVEDVLLESSPWVRILSSISWRRESSNIPGSRP
jgi:hypothetical protein